jgi:anti-sigma-K factor RskA
MMAYSEDHIALAAEYALGTLDADERAQVETMMSTDQDYMAMVLAWEHRLGALNQMVGAIEPRPELWEKIKAAIGHTQQQQAPIVLPEMESAPFAPIEIPDEPRIVAADTSNVVQFNASARRWRAIALATSAIAAALVAIIGIGASMPDLLPNSMRPKAVTQVAQKVTPAPAPRASAQYVALLQKDPGGPAFIMTVDEATRNFTVRKVGTSADSGSSFELWLISDRLPKPRSLGVIGSGDFTSRPVLASYDADTVKNATYAVTVEQAGGSPDGNPHSTPILAGKLIEAVPSAAR